MYIFTYTGEREKCAPVCALVCKLFSKSNSFKGVNNSGGWGVKTSRCLNMLLNKL